jgi:hypothetical protein
MTTGIFKINIDTCTETILKNFIFANSWKGGFNSYQLNKDIQKHGYIEKIVYKLAQHNISYTKNDNIDDFNVTFFTKCYKVTNNEVNMHIDFDDVDFIKNDKETITPVISSITYLSKSSNPTIITNITRDEIYDSDNINNIEIDKDVCSLLYYPDKYDHIVFEGGKYYHGEIPMDNNNEPFSNICMSCSNRLCEERLILVMFLWKKESLPIVPYFKNENIAYSIIDKDPYVLKTTGQLDRYIYDIINKDNNSTEDYKLDIYPKKVNIINYVDELLTYHFYRDLIHSGKHNLYKLNEICDYNIVNTRTNNRNDIVLQELNNVILLSINNTEINDIFDLKTEYNENYILDYNIFEPLKYDYTLDVIWKNKSIYDCYPIYKMHNVELQIHNEILEDNINHYLLNKHEIYKLSNVMLDVKKKYFSPLEKLVHDIADSSLKNINIPFDNNIDIEFWIKTEDDDDDITFHLDSSDTEYMIGYNIHPFLSNIYYLNSDNDNNYTVVSSLNMNDLKYGNKDKEMIFVKPIKNKLLTIFGGKNYHGNIKCNNNKRQLLILNYWYKLPHISINNYYNNTYNKNLYEKKQCITNMSISRNYNSIYIDNNIMKDANRKLLETKDKAEDYIELICRIDNTYDATLFKINNTGEPLTSIKFSLDTDNYKNYIEEEFVKLNKNTSVTNKKNISRDNIIKTTKDVVRKSNIIHKDNFDIYNYYIRFDVLYMLEAYIQLLESKFHIIKDNIDCQELDYRTHFDENMQIFIFKNLLLSVLDDTKKNNINIQNIKIRKNIVYDGCIDNNYICMPICNNINMQIESHKIELLKGGFIDINKETQICINSKELMLCIEYI